MSRHIRMTPEQKETSRRAAARAIELAGGSPKKVALLVNQSDEMVRRWTRSGVTYYPPGIRACLVIERTLGVPRAELRPDLYEASPAEGGAA